MSQFKIKKLLTLPLFKLTTDEPRYFRLTSEMFIGKEMKAAEGKKKMEPATLINVVDLESGEVGQIIANKVLESTLKEEFTDKGLSYVGKCFGITKLKRQEGKSYDKFSVAEIEDPTVVETAANPSPSGAGSSQTSGTEKARVAAGGKR